MKFLKYISLLAAGGLIYLLYNALNTETCSIQACQEQTTSSPNIYSPGFESCPVLYDVLTTLIPDLKY